MSENCFPLTGQSNNHPASWPNNGIQFIWWMPSTFWHRNWRTFASMTGVTIVTYTIINPPSRRSVPLSRCGFLDATPQTIGPMSVCSCQTHQVRVAITITNMSIHPTIVCTIYMPVSMSDLFRFVCVSFVFCESTGHHMMFFPYQVTSELILCPIINWKNITWYPSSKHS